MGKYIYTDKGLYVGWTNDINDINYLKKKLPDIILEDEKRDEKEGEE